MDTIELLIFRNRIPEYVAVNPDVLAALLAAPVPVEPTPGPGPLPPVTQNNRDLLGKEVGSRDGNPVYKAKNEVGYYELAGGYLWPRREVGSTKVDPAYTLPTGWGWRKTAGDGAWYIVPGISMEVGPDYLDSNQKKPDARVTPWQFNTPKEA